MNEPNKKPLSPEEAIDAMFRHFGTTAEMMGIKDDRPILTRIKPEEIELAAEEGNKALLERLKIDNVYAKIIWNEAIEAAAKTIEGAPLFAAEIRKLLK